jgi:predicted RNA-binding protein YlxR (DUF448 family)
VIGERTCAGCRARRHKPELIRFARTPSGSVAFDPSSALSGRGAYTCPKQECVERALKRGGLGRVLRTTITAEEASRLKREAVEYLSNVGVNI